MNSLTLVEKNGTWYADSREVAEMVGKRHDNLIRDIEGYIQIMETSNLRNGLNTIVSDFFVPNEYESSNPSRKYRNFLITRRGCDMVANKMTGEKGVLFTAAYVTKFEEMEKQISQSLLPNLSPQLQVLIQMEIRQQEIETKQKQIEDKLTTVDHRLSNLDGTNIEGTPRQRLNKMVQLYAYKANVTYQRAWKEFKGYYNTAFHTNLERRMDTYSKERFLAKNCSIPEYLEAVGEIMDGLRVADKMLNQLKGDHLQ